MGFVGDLDARLDAALQAGQIVNLGPPPWSLEE
jgi:hypothetical protein